MDPFLKAQKVEITEHHVYKALAKKASGHNKKILEQIANDELRHYAFWKKRTKKDVKPNMWHVGWHVLLANMFGLAFGLKLMETGEGHAIAHYGAIKEKDVKQLLEDEHRHENQLIEMIKDERLTYAGAIVLGLNDALVELTGALAGLTFALQSGPLIAISGIITGFAASLSMAASGYLQSKEEKEQNVTKDPIKGAIYTGIAYIITVVFLVAPYFLFDNVFLALAVTLSIAVLIIFLFNYYISIAKSQSFWRNFLTMALISLGVAALSFGVGIILRAVIGIEV